MAYSSPPSFKTLGASIADLDCCSGQGRVVEDKVCSQRFVGGLAFSHRWVSASKSGLGHIIQPLARRHRMQHIDRCSWHFHLGIWPSVWPTCKFLLITIVPGLLSINVGLERRLCASGRRSLGKLRIIGACPFPAVTIKSFRSRRRIEPPRLLPSDGLVYFRRHEGGQSCHRLGRRNVVSSHHSAGQSALVDSIPDIGVETRHPCSTNPPIVSGVFLSSAQCFQPIGSKSRKGGYCQICERL